MIAAQNGCESSFRQLHDLTKSVLFSAITRVNRDRFQAEEILQETYLNAWLMRTQFNSDRGHALSWLKVIAHHQAVSSLRSNSRRPQCIRIANEDDADYFSDCPSAEPSPMESACSKELISSMRKEVMALAPASRASVTLAYYEGLSHDQISQRLAKPLGSVKTWVRRSLISMRPALQAHR